MNQKNSNLLGHRNLKLILKSLFGKQHYVALLNMGLSYPNFFDDLRRYLTDKGNYPYQLKIRTPLGLIQPTLYHCYDMLTANEIFCRHDYYASKSVNVIVDIGSNIGISALYFLTRNLHSKCYLFEPDQRNISKLKRNLSLYEERYHLAEKAVAINTDIVEFGIESTGRYGGIGISDYETIQVECLGINDVLEDVLSKEDFIDILKLDIEGLEISTVEAIEVKYLHRIKTIYMEAQPNKNLHQGYYQQRQYGSICKLIHRNKVYN
jgi:FkbM family methyltransferase